MSTEYETPPKKQWYIIAVLSLLMGYASISTDMYLPALPSMSQSLQMNGWNVELTISSFLIGLCTGQLFWGPISDNYGRRLPIFAGITLFIVGSMGCIFSTTVPSMILWRIIQALGASTGPVLSRAMVQDLFSGNDRAKVFSNLITIMTLAPLIGPLLGGQIIQYSSWRTIFILLVFIGFITLFLIAKFPESFPKEKRDKTQKKRILRTVVA
ncbi:MFS transporter [Vibrio quintilis]|uniref:MFS transporter n=1 Tax=Vibrio quintilis TaxID=1117707 RepID=UPI0021C5C4FA|nr:MFS transporter [Vibrio quintilis]